jgi:hypothetical protein
MVPDGREQVTYTPDMTAQRTYDRLYEMYRELGADKGPVADVMRRLRVMN